MSETITKDTIREYKCEICGSVATNAVNELKEGVPDRGWQTWEWVAFHFYCDAHQPEPEPVPDQIFYGYQPQQESGDVQP